MGEALLERGEAGVGLPAVADRRAERAPRRIIGSGERNPAVVACGGIHARRHVVGTGVPDRALHPTAYLVVECGGGNEVDRALRLRQVEVLPLPRPSSMVERREQ